MRVLHLNYHHVLQDPRVLKQCMSLSQKGMDVSVICAASNDLKYLQQNQTFSVHCIDWMNTRNLTSEYLAAFDEFPLSKEVSKSRLEPIARVNGLKPALDELFLKVWGHTQPDSSVKIYRGLSGFAKLKAKCIYILKAKYFEMLLKREPYANILREIDPTASNLKNLSPYIFGKIRHNHVYQAAAFLFDSNVQNLTLGGTFDIIHAHDIYTLPAGVRLAKRFGSKLIYDAHEYEIERASKMPPEGNQIAKAIEDDCFKFVDAIFTVSSGICDLYSKRFTKRMPDLVLNSPLIMSTERSFESISQSRRSIRTQLGLSDNEGLVVYTGLVLKEQRGLIQVAKSLKYMPLMHLVILGPREKADDELLLEAARQIGVENRIHMLDSVPHSDVVRTIQGCDVSIVPFQDAGLSYRHAMPNKLFEGIFSGLPIAVSDLPDMGEFVKSLGRGKVMDASDPNSIAHTVLELYKNKDKYWLSDDAYNDLIQKYSWAAQADRIEKIYFEIHDATSARS